MRRRTAALAICFSLGFTPVIASAATKTLSVKDDSFTPSLVTVKRGTTVTWTWQGKHKHNVTVQSGPAKFASPTKKAGQFSRKLTKPGLYKILCTIHADKMKESIRVS